jgi:hypothetical protein
LSDGKSSHCLWQGELKRSIQLAAASDKGYQLLAHGRWFSPGTPASSTTKPGRHDIAEILLKVALNTKNQIKSNQSQLSILDFPSVFSNVYLYKINYCLNQVSLLEE